MQDQRTKAEILLKEMFGNEAVFRDGQWEAIEEIVVNRGRSLVVQRTGWGKSLVYFLATRLLRDEGAGLTLLISPLLSLMRNQIAMAERLHIRSATINSDNKELWDEIEERLANNDCDILLISPERLNNERFLTQVLAKIGGRIGLFVVDEAHCISDWGHDFRPDYRRIVRVLQALPPKVPVLCTTATANTRVVNDIVAQIGADLKVLRGSLTRSSLHLHNLTLADQSERLAWLAENLNQFPVTGIIYCLTVPDTQRVCRWLNRKGVSALPYYADLSNEEKTQAEDALLHNKVKALVATVALGMGYDKPDLGFVIHFQRPGSVVAYYQQVGRAGRAVDEAFGILLNGREDDEISDYFIRTAFPAATVMEKILEVLAKTSTAGLNDIMKEVNIRRSFLEKALKLLEIDGAIGKEGSRYFRTLNRWSAEQMRVEEVTKQRREEVAEMNRYVTSTSCLMEFLARSLDDPFAQPCGKCMNCTGERLPVTINSSLIQEAIDFLRSDKIIIEPRKQWAAGAVADFSGRIPEALRAQEGRALSIYADAGWGRQVANCKYVTGEFNEELVTAAAELIVNSWQPEPPPAWVTAVPSLRHPQLVYNFAERLADRLGLPFVPVLQKKREIAEQKTMENSAQQMRNVIDAFTINAPIPEGAVLLIDDVVDSKWTITAVAWLLLKQGSGMVYPFALATAALGSNS